MAMAGCEQYGMDWELAELEKLEKWAALTGTEKTDANYKLRARMLA